MTVKSILDEKGRDVVTIDPDKTLSEAVKILSDKRIGAVIAVRSGRIAGILSERDIVRVIGKEGAGALLRPVSSAMTASVKTCNESHSVNEVMDMMTRGRFRHLPVEEGSRLVGVVSIGDVVKRRIEDVEREAAQIKEYIASA